MQLSARQSRACAPAARAPGATARPLTRTWQRPRPAAPAAPAGLAAAAQGGFSLAYEDPREDMRRNLRTVFDHDSWLKHRSFTRYARHILGIFSSHTMAGLWRPLLYVVGVSAAAASLELLRAAGSLPSALPALRVSPQLFGLTSFALALLLVFRTNASYERWDGARKTWGLLLNRSRDLVRQGLTYIPRDKPELRSMLCRWVPAFSKTLMCHLRRNQDVRTELQGILLPDEVDQVVLAQHRPNYVLQVLSEIIRTGRVRATAALRMEENLTVFEDCLGGCERVLRTPVPLSYTRHTSRFLMIWLTLLPFSLAASCGLATIPLCTVVAFLLLGIEDIGVSIEEPFSILPLEAISGTVLTNVRELQATHGAAGGRARGDAGAAAAPAPLSASHLVTRHGVAASEAAVRGMDLGALPGAAQEDGAAGAPAGMPVWPRVRAGLAASNGAARAAGLL